MLKRIGIITSGGDSPGMNPAVRSIVRTGTGLGVEVVGIQNGYQGIFDREFMPLGSVEVSGRIRDAGTVLSTSRCLKFKEASAQKEAIEILKKENIQALLVLGGDGSLAGAPPFPATATAFSACPAPSTTTFPIPSSVSARIPASTPSST